MLHLGRGTVVSSFTKIKVTDGTLRTGEKCGFGCGCFVDTGSAGIEIGDHAVFGPNVSIVAVNYRYQSLEVPFAEQDSLPSASESGETSGLARTP